MAKKEQHKKDISSGAPLSGGGSGAISGLGSVSAADRVAQVKALQAMSPFAAVSPDVKLDVEKGFDLEQGAFNVRSSTLQRMGQSIQKVTDRTKTKIFGQHIEGLTFQKDGQERIRHTVTGANTGLLSVDEAMELRGGFYDDPSKLKQDRKGVVE